MSPPGRYRRGLRPPAPEDGGILADEYPGKTKPDRVGDELVQRHLERGTVAGRVGQPLSQAIPLRRDVQDEYPAGQIVDDHAGKVPQFPALRGGSWSADARPKGAGGWGDNLSLTACPDNVTLSTWKR
jgi:hypothetical protein